MGPSANRQVGVFLGYASPHGHVGRDHALFLPRDWLEDRARAQQVGIPQALPYRTKPQLALDAGVPAAWVVADEIYGNDRKLRQVLEARSQAYVLTVRSNQPVSTWPPYGPPSCLSVGDLALTIPPAAWKRRSCEEGARGPRVHDWALVPARPALREGWVHAVLLRRHPVRTEELAYYLLYAPITTPLAEIVRAVGTRWTIEEVFKLAKGQVELDQYEVRSWQGWYRHVTLALVALAALTIGARKRGGRLPPPHPDHRSRNPTAPRAARLGRQPAVRAGRGLVPLMPTPPEIRPSLSPAPSLKP
ncbi:transposase (fragment) [Nitrolancea hollandica Lb]|uniref:Transposase n=1 Tax=Nitrolancea hollandica Lb TaxID=1129897 RepID=I4ECH1_9BACT